MELDEVSGSILRLHVLESSMLTVDLSVEGESDARRPKDLGVAEDVCEPSRRRRGGSNIPEPDHAATTDGVTPTQHICSSIYEGSERYDRSGSASLNIIIKHITSFVGHGFDPGYGATCLSGAPRSGRCTATRVRGR